MHDWGPHPSRTKVLQLWIGRARIGRPRGEIAENAWRLRSTEITALRSLFVPGCSRRVEVLSRQSNDVIAAAGAVGAPSVHEPPALLQEIGALVSGLHLVRDCVRQRCLCNLTR